MTTTYWKANKATSEKLKVISKESDDYVKSFFKDARKRGFSARIAFGRSIFGAMHVVGFYTKRNQCDPDPKVYKKSKSSDDRGHYCWIPKRIKQNKELLSRMDKSYPVESSRTEILGIESWVGEMIYTMGVSFVNGTAYIQLNECQGKPNGCRRISDLTYENAMKKKA